MPLVPEPHNATDETVAAYCAGHADGYAAAATRLEAEHAELRSASIEHWRQLATWPPSELKKLRTLMTPDYQAGGFRPTEIVRPYA